MIRSARTLGVAAVFALAALSSGSSAQQPARGFDGFFADKTMRVDYFHSGGVGQEIVALERIVSDGPWPGSRTKLVDDSNLGKYLFEVIDRNIATLERLREDQARRRSLQSVLADAITSFSGRMVFIYLHAVWFGAWIAVNQGLVPGMRPFDRFPYGLLTMVVSLEAIFLSTFVLISQNRMQVLADRRADLDLQVSLLAEHEITQLVALVTEMAKRMEIEQAHDPELRELAQDVAPEKVLDEMESHAREFRAVPRRR